MFFVASNRLNQLLAEKPLLAAQVNRVTERSLSEGGYSRVSSVWKKNLMSFFN